MLWAWEIHTASEGGWGVDIIVGGSGVDDIFGSIFCL